jgi:hypothetical protein
MVNLVDAFTKEFGKPPTQEQLAKMMELKAEIDAYKNKAIKPKENMIEKSKTGKANATEYARENPKGHKKEISVSPRIIQINKMIWYKLSNEQIADVLNVDVGYITNTIKKYHLPRHGLKQIEYRTGARK